MLDLLLLPRLATSDPPLPLCLYFTADRRSARAPPAWVIYDQQLLMEPMTHAAGCQMWSPWKQKLIGSLNSAEARTGEGGRGKEESRGTEMEWQIWRRRRKNKWIERKQMRAHFRLKEEPGRETADSEHKFEKVREESATCGTRPLIWMHRLSSALISAGAAKAKCLYYFISQLAARRLLSPCAYWPASLWLWLYCQGERAGGGEGEALHKRSIAGEWLDYGVINALY